MDKRIFYVDRSPIPGHTMIKGLKEEELTEKDYLQLYNKLIKCFNDSPELVQINFHHKVHTQFLKLQEALDKKNNENTVKEESGESSVTGITDTLPSTETN